MDGRPQCLTSLEAHARSARYPHCCMPLQQNHMPYHLRKSRDLGSKSGVFNRKNQYVCWRHLTVLGLLFPKCKTIEQFGSFSGLKINWEKSQILPIDSLQPSRTQAQLPLQRVTIIRYLGVHISQSPVDYISLNIDPIYTLIKSKIQTWARLPLGVWGRINLIKMVLLPKILYILWHIPVYLPLKYFKSFEALLKPFVWDSNRHKLAWWTLKNPTDLGGTALPDLNLYYIASQLSQLFHIDKTDKEIFSILLCPTWAQQTWDPIFAIAMGSGGADSEGDSKTLLYQYRWIWDLILLN